MGIFKMNKLCELTFTLFILNFVLPAKKWTTQDLIKYYKYGCEKNGAKALTKVLQQLQVGLMDYWSLRLGGLNV